MRLQERLSQCGNGRDFVATQLQKLTGKRTTVPQGTVLESSAPTYARQSRSRRFNRRMLTLLGCLVVIATCLALMEPVISITGDVATRENGFYIETQATDPSGNGSQRANAAKQSKVVNVTDNSDNNPNDPDDEQSNTQDPSPSSEDDEGSEGAADAGEDSDPSDEADDNGSTDSENTSSNESSDPDTSNSAEAINPSDESEQPQNPDVIEGEGSGSSDAPSPDDEPIAMPAQSFREQLRDEHGNVTLTVAVEAPEGAFAEGTSMQIKRVADTDVKDQVESVIKDDIVQMTAVDITFVDASGSEVEPATNIEVKITSDVVRDINDPVLVHVFDKEKGEGPGAASANTDVNPANPSGTGSGSQIPGLGVSDDAEIVKRVEVVNEDESHRIFGTEDTLKFTTDAFSIYVIVETTIEQTVLASDGNTYRVSVTYGPEAGIPEGAALDVTEIGTDDANYTDYLSKTLNALGYLDVDYAKLFDISIIDKDEPSIHYQPQTGVSVLVELLDAEAADEGFSVVHFGQDAELLDASTDGNTVAFETNGFSAYAIVRGPGQVEGYGWTEVTSLDEIATLSSQDEGFYISHNDGYYATNIIEKKVGGNSSRTGIKKTAQSKNDPDSAAGAVFYYFQKKAGTNDQYYIYCLDDGGAQQFVKQSSNSLSFVSSQAGATLFTVSEFPDRAHRFRILGTNGYYWNMQGGANGKAFAAYNNDTDVNAVLKLEYFTHAESDPYALGGKTYGLVNYTGGTSSKALMAKPLTNSSLDAVVMTITTKAEDREDKLYVPKDSDITMWTFQWAHDDYYHVSAEVDGGLKYLQVSTEGVTMTDDEALVRVVPGAGANAGKIRLESGKSTIAYSGDITTGFVADSPSSEYAWLNFVELSELTSDYLVTYSASKVSVSDTERVTNGSRVIVYTRVWNDARKRYEFYAIDHDGSLVPCYESGDSIEWIGAALNTLLWNFTEYYYEGTVVPNYYYELYNQYSKRFIAPQILGGQVLSDRPVGINLNGRRYGDYYSSILAWDDPYYAYAGLKVENGRIVSGPMSQAEDFYFAIVQDPPVDDELTVVDTVDHKQYGITMKMVDFSDKYASQNASVFHGGKGNEQDLLLDDNTGGMNAPPTQGLLSTNLGEDGYPTAVKTGKSFGELYAKAQEVNHLFLQGTFSGTGYYEFDSTQNYARLNEETGDFTLYKELGTNDSGGSKPSLKHGQFFPYNDLIPGKFASTNGQNLYDAMMDLLPETDPRKYEQLRLIAKPDYYFGMEVSASFVQTPDGRDAWGHDIIYEFTGDDDFWLYVDGELVIDLGGIHSALAGNVNFCTGDVMVNDVQTTLYDVFKSNFEARGMSADEVASKLDEIFAEKTVNGKKSYIFKDYTTHTMRIFYMERGAGASNLHMRFNLASVKPGQIVLNKQISGTNKPDYKLAEYGYQIYYQITEDDHWALLDDREGDEPNVTYLNTNTPVKYLDTFTPAGGTVPYRKVFFLTPGQSAAITIPEEAVRYKIIECGVNTQVYDQVKINDEEITGTDTQNPNRKDYSTSPASPDERQRVIFDNHVSQSAKRTLTIEKRLFEADGTTEITDDPTGFSFRLYLGNENATELSPANTQDYQVKNPDGQYCTWDFDTQSFVSTGKTDFDQLSATQKDQATFQTSPNGAISKIPAGYKVEVRDLLVGTRFEVVERAGDIPAGYSFIEYERVDGSYIVKSNEAVNSGTVRDKESPQIRIRNKRGFGLTAKKVWSDASFMENHGDIFIAVYVKGELLDNSVRRIAHPATSTYYYWDGLVEGASFSDYEIREVTLEGNYTVDEDTGEVSGYTDVTAIDNGETLDVSAKAKEDAEAKELTYTVTYTTGTITGTVDNVRTDTVTNSRHGIRLVKKDWRGSKGEPLAGATFVLTDSRGNTVGEDSYTSDLNGLITVAYVNVNTNYTLTETSSPAQYHGLENPITFRLNPDGVVEVIEGDSDYYEVAQVDAKADTMASIIIKNRPFALRVIKHGVQIGGTEAPLPDAQFSLHREATVDGVTTMDFNPIPGYSGLTSNENGIVSSVDESLSPGVYYLKEDSAPAGYGKLAEAIKFSISDTGVVTLSATDCATLSSSVDNQTLVYTITVTNKMASVPVKIVKIDQSGNALAGATFDIEGGDAIESQTGITTAIGADGNALIYENQALPIGTYTLTETNPPAGYNALEGPVIVKVEASNDGITVSASINGVAIGYPKVSRDNESGVWTVKVTNTAGYELPNTGGIGTHVLYAIGTMLVLGAIALLLARRKAD